MHKLSSHLPNYYSVYFFHIFPIIISSHIVFYIRCTPSNIELLAQLMLWNILYIFLVCQLLLKVVVFHTCLQQSDLKSVRHAEHLPGFSFCICLFLTLLFLILLLRINSLRFLFRLVIGCQSIISFTDSFIYSKFQCFCFTLLIFGHKQL